MYCPKAIFATKQTTMKREQLIKEASEAFAIRMQTKEGTASRLNAQEWYKCGINSQLAKDLTDLAVIEGKIEVLMWVNLRVSFADILKSDIYRDIEQLSSTRTELLTKLNLKG